MSRSQSRVDEPPVALWKKRWGGKEEGKGQEKEAAAKTAPFKSEMPSHWRICAPATGQGG